MIILTIVRHGESTGTSGSERMSAQEHYTHRLAFAVAADNLKPVWAGSADAPLSSHGAS